MRGICMKICRNEESNGAEPGKSLLNTSSSNTSKFRGFVVSKNLKNYVTRKVETRN